MSRRLGVVGSLVLDTIRRAGDEEPARGPGGIAYSLAAFEASPAPGWGTVPILKVGEGAREPARGLLERLGTVASAEGVRQVVEPNARVELVYADDGGRTERLTGGVPGWSWDELAPLAEDCDALYVNLIAGWELDLACARRLRASFPGPTWCDFHSLLLGRRPDGVRFPRAPEGWEEWFRCFDHVQLNEDELALLAGEAGRPPRDLAEELVREGPRALFVTLGAGGAAWVAAGGGRGDGARAPGIAAGARSGAEPREGPRHGRVPLAGRVERADPTGCGDVWGITCFGSLLAGAGLWEAVARANRLATRNAAARGIDGLLDAARSGEDAVPGPVDGGGDGPAGPGGSRRSGTVGS